MSEFSDFIFMCIIAALIGYSLSGNNGDIVAITFITFALFLSIIKIYIIRRTPKEVYNWTIILFIILFIICHISVDFTHFNAVTAELIFLCIACIMLYFRFIGTKNGPVPIKFLN